MATWAYNSKTGQYEQVPEGLDPNQPYGTQMANLPATTTANPNQDLLDQIAALQAQVNTLTNKTALLAPVATSTTPAVTPVSANGDTVPWQEANPEESWNSLYGVPAMGASPNQAWVANQYSPSYAGYFANSLLNPSANPSDWANYMGTQGFGGAVKSAANLFKQALTNPMGQGGFIQEMNSGLSGTGATISDFIQNMLRNYYAAPVAKALAGNLGNLQSQYVGETQGGGTNFLDYLVQKYNLGNLIGA